MDYETSNLLFSFFQALLTGVGIFVAARGLDTWKKQLHGNDKYTISKELLKSIYELRDNIQITRNPFVHVHEFGEVPDNPYHPKNYYEMSYAYKNRYDKAIDSRRKINNLLLDGEVIWGDNLINLFKKLFEKQHQLSSNIGWYLDSLIDKSYIEIYDKSIIYGVGGDDDIFFTEVQDIITEIDSFLKPNLK